MPPLLTLGLGVVQAPPFPLPSRRALRMPPLLTLGLVVVHAILASQRLDQVLQRHVPAYVVAGADGALDLWWW